MSSSPGEGASTRRQWIAAAAIAAFGVSTAWYLRSLASSGLDEPVAWRNSALVFIKPHGQVDGMATFVEKELVGHGLRIVNKGQLPGKAIADNGTIDAHYAAIGAYAMTVDPAELHLSDETKKAFEVKYGESFESSIGRGVVLNANSAMQRFGMSGPELGAAFQEAKEKGGLRLAPGCYIAYFPSEKMYVVNGFYASMREEYTNRKALVSWMVVSWQPEKLSWKDFRSKVLGATEPKKAHQSSIRARILSNAKQLKLGFEPSTGKNCVHGSASPLEALNERLIWTGVKSVAKDSYGIELLKAGFTVEEVEVFRTNPIIDGTPLFDLVEDTNSDECISLLKSYSHKLSTR